MLNGKKIRQVNDELKACYLDKVINNQTYGKNSQINPQHVGVFNDIREFSYDKSQSRGYKKDGSVLM